MTFYLADLVGRLRWLASSTLPKISGPQIEDAVKALLEEEIRDESRREALKLQSFEA